MAVVLAASPIASCSLPREVTGAGLDAAVDGATQANDVGPRPDAWSVVDAWRPPGDDAWTMPGDDAWAAPIDAWIAPIDAWTAPIDAWSPPPDAWPPDCTATFMASATAFQLCPSAMTSCSFYLQLGSGRSCDDVCARTGHTCTAEFDNDATNHCMPAGSALACSHNIGDAICTCSWP
jgi:hypothetical protein